MPPSHASLGTKPSAWPSPFWSSLGPQSCLTPRVEKEKGGKIYFPSSTFYKSSCFSCLFPFGLCGLSVKFHLKTPAGVPPAKGNTDTSALCPRLAGEEKAERRGRGGPGAKGAGAGPDSATDFPKPRSLPLRNRSLHTGLLSSSPAPGLSRPPGGSRAQGLPCGAPRAERRGRRHVHRMAIGKAKAETGTRGRG